jgi:hypothetical protein
VPDLGLDGGPWIRDRPSAGPARERIERALRTAEDQPVRLASKGLVLAALLGAGFRSEPAPTPDPVVQQGAVPGPAEVQRLARRGLDLLSQGAAARVLELLADYEARGGSPTPALIALREDATTLLAMERGEISLGDLGISLSPAAVEEPRQLMSPAECGCDFCRAVPSDS